jgi:protein-tyrosine-phosphatase
MDKARGAARNVFGQGRGRETVLYVCTSNTCRSPIAMHLARERVRELGRDDAVAVRSRGLTDHYSAWGSPADPRAARALSASTGLASDGHGSAELTAAELDACLACFYFTEEHVEWVASCIGDAPVQRALREKRLRKITADGSDVPDPFFMDDQFYQAVCLQIKSSVNETLDALLQEVDGAKSGR